MPAPPGRPSPFPAAQANLGQTNPTAFAFAPSQPHIAYATTFDTPLMKSTDAGATWQPAASIQSAGENAIAVDPRDPSIVWLVNGAGIQKSTDGGTTFQRVANPGDGSWRSIAVSPADSSQVFASDLHNVYATYDGGGTWAIAASGQVNAVFETGGRLYVAGSVPPTVFVTKFDPTESRILFSTFIGTGSVSRIAVDGNGNAFIAGTTVSQGFPVTPNAVGRTFASASAGFVVKLRAEDGALIYSTLLDGLQPNALAIDSSGDAVIAGAASGPVPVTSGAYQSTAPGPCTRSRDVTFLPGASIQLSTHAFAAKLNSDATAFAYATYLTGSCGDAANDVVLDSGGNAWVGGVTYSLDFPVTPGALADRSPRFTRQASCRS